MAPLKKFFTGEVTPPSPRLTNIQKCIRTNDIESVGDTSHLTFFEMMGNWSIGDYFKRDALTYANDLLVDKFKFEPIRLHVSVYSGDPMYPNIPPDEEAHRIWSDLGFPEDRIHALGAEDNFWGPAGNSGPCGPCSEVYYDLGQNTGCGKEDCGLNCDCGRYLEIWNPGVFMQYYKGEDGSFSDLPFKNIDAGAGIERFAMVLQGAKSVYDTDLLRPIAQNFIQENDLRIDESVDNPQIRIVTDHLRAATFMVADDIYPSNTRREYVVRRLIRRMVANANLMGAEQVKLEGSIEGIIQSFGEFYPELRANETKITPVINQEVRKFLTTLDKSKRALDKMLKQSPDYLSGENAFSLQETYGLPIEILQNIAQFRNFQIDIERYQLKMEEHRQKSRENRK